MPDETSRPPPAWRAGSPQDLVWTEFGDDCVVYHRPSGKTHFLNAATAVLLEEILTVPRDAHAAAEALAAREEAEGDAAFFAAVADSLLHLEYLGLVERCDA